MLMLSARSRSVLVDVGGRPGVDQQRGVVHQDVDAAAEPRCCLVGQRAHRTQPAGQVGEDELGLTARRRRSRSTTAPPRSALRPVTITCAPAAAKACAMPAPMPPVDPVTNAVRPANRSLLMPITLRGYKMDRQVQSEEAAVTTTLTAKGTATRARIIEGAAAAIRAEGVAATTLDDVCSRTHTSKSQLFHYFPGGQGTAAARGGPARGRPGAQRSGTVPVEPAVVGGLVGVARRRRRSLPPAGAELPAQRGDIAARLGQPRRAGRDDAAVSSMAARDDGRHHRHAGAKASSERSSTPSRPPPPCWPACRAAS